MIFVTIGTHEDQFDRLITTVDDLVATGAITEPVIMQTGSSQPPRHCEWHEMMSFDDVQATMTAARVVITHGGPATIMQVFALGKIPVVVPRNPDFGEHVDGHQLDFAEHLSDRVIVVHDVAELADILADYPGAIAHLPDPEPPASRIEHFSARLETEITQLLTTHPSRRSRS